MARIVSPNLNIIFHFRSTKRTYVQVPTFNLFIFFRSISISRFWTNVQLRIAPHHYSSVPKPLSLTTVQPNLIYRWRRSGRVITPSVVHGFVAQRILWHRNYLIHTKNGPPDVLDHVPKIVGINFVPTHSDFATIHV